MKALIYFSLAIILSSNAFALPPDSLWSRTYGGGGEDKCWSVKQTTDGGYILAGNTTSSGAGGQDMLLVRTDGNGNQRWSRTYGGSGNDQAWCVRQTTDGGFIMGGYRNYADARADQLWLVKTDTSGNLQWSKDYGGAGGEECYDIVQMQDGSYMVAGDETSYGAGSHDMWLLRISPAGDSLWSRTYGGPGDDRCLSLQQTTDGGWVLGGWTNSWGAGSLDFWVLKTNASGDSLWSHTFGGIYVDECYSVIQTADGGYALAGFTDSFGAGQNDYWLIKLDAGGNYQWDRTYGMGNMDRAYAVRQTLSGGYILCGYAFLGGAHGYDLWVVKTDGNGNIEWTRDFGGTNEEDGLTFDQTADGGYIFGGFTASFGAGGFDMWLLKTGPEIPPAVAVPPPDSLWSRTYGGSNDEWCYDMRSTSDGGYVMAGVSSTYTAGGYDGWAVKCNASGDTLWTKHYGGGSDDDFHSVQPTFDGGYAFAGTTQSSGAGLTDMWLVKTDGNGNQQWSRTYGGTNQDWCEPMQQTSDGGYILAGATWSFGAGIWDLWLVKTNANGDSLWSRTFGGSADDAARAVIQTTDGGFLAAGYSISFSGTNYDFYVVKTDSNGNLQWQHIYGGGGNDYCYDARQTSDGGYILAGRTTSFGAGGMDFYLVKIDANGSQQWSRTYGGTGDDWCYRVHITSDGGFLLGGYTTSFGSGDKDYYIVKTDAHGQQEWSRTFGGNNWDECQAVLQSHDGSFVFAGTTHSSGAGGYDMWLVKSGQERDIHQIQWTDSTGGSWFDWTNWNPQQVPGPLDTALITRPENYTITIGGNANVGQLVLGSGLPTDTTHQTLSVSCASCSLAIHDNSVIRSTGILRGASSATVSLTGSGLALTDSGQINMLSSANLNLGAANALSITTGILAFSDSARLSNGGVVTNSGVVSHSGGGTSTLVASYRDQGAVTRQSVLINSGKLTITPADSAVYRSIVQIEGGATLETSRAQFKDSSTVNGTGSLTLAGGAETIAGYFPLTGSLHVNGGSTSFQPHGTVALDSFTVGTGTSFVSSVVVNAAQVALNGGTTNTGINVTTRCDWTAGGLTGPSGSNLTISPGVGLYLSGPGAKTLDTRDLIIDGSAVMSGSGILSLINTASITVTANGSLAIGDSMTINGTADSLINNGQMTVQCPQDTSVINAFLWNNPSGRTPGTIDILSGRVVCARTRNDGTVIIRDQAEARLLGNCLNAGLIDMREGTTWYERDSLINLPSGILYLAGNASIEGGGVVQNGGHMYRQGSQSRTPSSSSILTAFHNLATTGFLDVTVDTLAVLNPSSDNAGAITIYAGAVLQVGSTFTNTGTINGGGQMSVSINNLVIQYESGNILLSWTDIPGATHYDVYAATVPYDNIQQYSLIATVYDHFFFHYQGASLAKRFYRVIAR